MATRMMKKMMAPLILLPSPPPLPEAAHEADSWHFQSTDTRTVREEDEGVEEEEAALEEDGLPSLSLSEREAAELTVKSRPSYARRDADVDRTMHASRTTTGDAPVPYVASAAVKFIVCRPITVTSCLLLPSLPSPLRMSDPRTASRPTSRPTPRIRFRRETQRTRPSHFYFVHFVES